MKFIYYFSFEKFIYFNRYKNILVRKMVVSNVENEENEELEEKELEEIKNLIHIYYNISNKISDGNISPYTKFVLGEILGKIFYKMDLIGDLIYYKKLDNEKLENVEKILNYLNENLGKIKDIENIENKLRILDIDFDYFMDKLIFKIKR